MELAREGVSHSLQLPERMSRAVRGDRLRRLTPRAVSLACRLCIADDFPVEGRDRKQAWAEETARRVKGGDRGLLLPDGGRPVAALDYRPQVLETFLRQAHRHGYAEVQVVAGRASPHPNGPAAFFLRHGFRELAPLGEIALEDGHDQMVLRGREVARRR